MAVIRLLLSPSIIETSSPSPLTEKVFKLGADAKEPLLILGVALQPGSDNSHFCQPTDVAVDPVTGSVYISDGYCNSRIIQFSPNGLYVMQWGEG